MLTNRPTENYLISPGDTIFTLDCPVCDWQVEYARSVSLSELFAKASTHKYNEHTPFPRTNEEALSHLEQHHGLRPQKVIEFDGRRMSPQSNPLGVYKHLHPNGPCSTQVI